jgi:hypothetical protein
MASQTVAGTLMDHSIAARLLECLARRSPLCDKRQVVRGLRAAEENAIEPFVVHELVQHFESKTVTVEHDYWGQVIGLANNAQVRLAEIGRRS